jgi:hypothetical protein
MAGLLLGVGIAIGALVSVGLVPQLQLQLPVTELQATATSGTDNFVVATGTLSSDVEGLFFMDAMSGNLQFTIFNPNAMKFNPLYVRNVAADLQIEAGKKPRYLMVTGYMRNSRRPTNQNSAKCAVYVVEATSGKFAAYTVPWQDSGFKSGRVQMGELILLGVGTVQTAAIRE